MTLLDTAAFRLCPDAVRELEELRRERDEALMRAAAAFVPPLGCSIYATNYGGRVQLRTSFAGVTEGSQCVPEYAWSALRRMYLRGGFVVVESDQLQGEREKRERTLDPHLAHNDEGGNVAAEE